MADGATQAIANATWPDGVLAAYVSPDGRYIAFGPGSSFKGPREVHLIASDGSGETVLAAHPAGEYPVGWSPDGKYVVFVSMRASGPALWAIPVANGKAQGAAIVLSGFLGDGMAPLGITRSGTFHYRIHAMKSDVYTASMDPATGKVISSPSLIPLSTSGNNVAPRWSPDSRRLLVTSSQILTAGRPKEFSIYSFEANKQQAVGTDRQIRGAGWCWAADGRSFLTIGPDKPFITRVHLGTSETLAAFDGPPVYSISCSANGKLVAFQESTQKFVKVRDMDSGFEREIYKFTDNAWGAIPEISPDGKEVAFLLRDSNGFALMVTPTDGGAARELARVKRPMEFQGTKGLAWSPDSRQIYYLKRAESKSPHELFRIAATGGQEESVGLKAADIRDLNIAPDGSRIAFSIGNVWKPEIWAIENFLPATAK